jgi:hypothetical protein
MRPQLGLKQLAQYSKGSPGVIRDAQDMMICVEGQS